MFLSLTKEPTTNSLVWPWWQTLILHCSQLEHQPTAAGPSLPSPSNSGDLVEHVPPPPSPLANVGKCPSSLSIDKWDIAKHLGAGTRLSASEKADLIKNVFKPSPSITFPWRFFGKQRRALVWYGFSNRVRRQSRFPTFIMAQRRYVRMSAMRYWCSDNRTKVKTFVTSAWYHWWHAGPYFGLYLICRFARGRRTLFKDLVYSPSRDAAYWLPCILFSSTSTPTSKASLVTCGFSNWKDAKTKFNGHFLGSHKDINFKMVSWCHQHVWNLLLSGRACPQTPLQVMGVHLQGMCAP